MISSDAAVQGGRLPKLHPCVWIPLPSWLCLRDLVNWHVWFSALMWHRSDLNLFQSDLSHGVWDQIPYHSHRHERHQLDDVVDVGGIERLKYKLNETTEAVIYNKHHYWQVQDESSESLKVGQGWVLRESRLNLKVWSWEGLKGVMSKP